MFEVPDADNNSGKNVKRTIARNTNNSNGFVFIIATPTVAKYV